MTTKLKDAEYQAFAVASSAGKKPYEKPRVTTLGRIADLTNGGGASAGSDALSTRSSGHGHSPTPLDRHTH